jgi:N-acyl-phosphatidylethanolamine-hydrolysing phospholipase D
MKSQHVDPEEAVQIHLDVQAKKSLGIHWGTFNLSCEVSVCKVFVINRFHLFALLRQYYLDPPIRLQESLQAKGLPADDFFTMRHGEIRTIEDSVDSLD